MAEEKIRYRIELDPRQVEGQLASLRTAIGNNIGSSIGGVPGIPSGQISQDLGSGRSSLAMFGSALGDIASGVSSGVQYAGSLAVGASNSISADLSRAQQAFASAPGFRSATRGLIEGGLEAATSAASVGVPLTIASAGMFGVGTTASGIASGIGVMSSMGAGAAGLAGSAVAGGAGLGLGVGRMMLAGAFSPVGLGLAGAMAAGSAITSVGERVIEDFRAGNAITDVLASRGLSQERAASMGTGLVSRGRDIGLGGAELTGILETGLSTGLLGAGRDPRQMGERLVNVAKQAKEVMSILNGSLGEAMQHMAEMNQMGIGVNAAPSVTLGMQTLGASTGMGTGVMGRAAGMGAQMATTMGLATGTGAGVAMEAMARAQAGASLLNESQLAAVGGISGLGQTMAQAQIGFMGTPLARAMMAGLGPGGMGQLATGNAGVAGAINRATANFTAGGPGAMASNLFNLDRQMSEMTQSDQRMMQLGMVRQMSNMFGLDPSVSQDRDMLAMRFGSMMGLDVSSAPGRAQAQAMLGGVLDPSTGIRAEAELMSRAQEIRDDSMGLMNMLGRGATRLGRATLGRVAGGITSRINTATDAAGTAVSRFGTDFTRGFRGGIRSIGQMTGINMPVRSAEEESFSLRVSRGLTQSAAATQVFMKTLASDEGITVEEFIKSNQRIGPRKTAEQIAQEQNVRDLFRGEIKIGKESGEVGDFLASLSPSEREELAGMDAGVAMADISTRMGKNAPSLKAIATAMRVEFGEDKLRFESLDVGRQAALKTGEQASRSAREMINNLAIGGSGAASRLGQRALMKFGLLGGEDTARIKMRDLLTTVGDTEDDRVTGVVHIQNLLNATGAERQTAVHEARKALGDQTFESIRNQLKDIKSDPAVSKIIKSQFNDISDMLSKELIQGAVAAGAHDPGDPTRKEVLKSLDDVRQTGSAVTAAEAQTTGTGVSMDRATVSVLQDISRSLSVQRQYNMALLDFVRGRTNSGDVSDPERSRQAGTR